MTTGLVAGVVVRGDAETLRSLAAKAEVTSIRLMTPKVPMNKGTDMFTKAMSAWQQTGLTGRDVTIGVIDSGMDYTHASFGGPGTVEAYAAAYGADGTGPVPDGSFDPTKYLGGYDFAGYAYDASSTDPAAWTPVPDENPIDAPAGHGTHVTGTVAGFGVQADGTTFRGDYSALTDVSDFQVGPGSAPEAGVYALKVFGDVEGSTNLTLQALEWAADPNDDGDYSDRLDIVNLSLGSDYGPADDPENAFIDKLAELGTLAVIASGNAGDIVDVGGSPGNARSALTVANSVGDSFTYDAVEVTESDSVPTGLYAAQNTIAYTGPDVTAPVVYLGPAVDGCTDLSGYAEQIAGAIVWLYWDDNDGTRACGSGARWANAAAAGAAGAIVGWSQPVFTYGLTGSALIPGAMLTAAATAALLPDIEAGSLTMTIGPGLAGAAFESAPDAADLLNDGSSRGVHGSLGIVKPDVAAPGTSISSVNAGSGAGATIKSGTSMATPHVAGIAALVRQQHPDWTALQVKAAVMNTATHDVFTGPGRTGLTYAPERVGSGRVDALAAVTDEVIAFAKDDPALVSVSFGVVPVGAKAISVKKQVTVSNTASATRSFATSFASSTGAGGASISVSPATIRLRPGASTTVTVTLRVDPATLAKQIDPTSVADYPFGAREFVTTVSGRLVLTDKASGGTLRLPVQAAPKLVSAMSGKTVSMKDATSAPLTLAGRDVLSGGWYSLVAPMVLATESPALGDDAPVGAAPSVVGAGDLRQIGYSSTAPQLAAAGADPADGVLAIGVATAGEWTSLGSTVYVVVDIDVDSDGVPDFESVVWKSSEPDYDFTTAETYSLDPDTGAFDELVDIWPVNALPADLETSVFDSNVVVVPVSIAALGLEPGMTPSFTVFTYSP
ncbi:MAG TPA: S8 family serine peptidase, partial [Actinotalea sp.]|nr:S8 family serine peptidase [Actinotalea sp.]